MYSRKTIFIVIFLGFISSIVLSSYYIIKYDKYRDDGYTHVMLKDETLSYWKIAAKIIEDVKRGENFFLSGEWSDTKHLPARLVAIYSLLSGYEIIDEWEPNIKIKLGGKLPFLIAQSLVYYLALVYLVLKISKIFPIKNCFYIVFFLAFEHTMVQYHSSFWSESFYFTLQILILGLLLNNSHKTFDNLLIGIGVGIMFLQRSAAVFYLIPIIIYFIFSYRSKSIKPIIVSVIGYTVIVSLLVIYNYKKTNVLYFYPPEGKRDVYLFFSIPLLAIKNKISGTEISKQEAQKAYKWLKDNNFKLKDELDIDKITNPFALLAFMKSEKDKIKFYDYTNKRQYEILIENPLLTIKKTISRIAHFSVLDPTHNYYYNDYRGYNKQPPFIESQTHKKLIPYRIIYTLLIYFVCFFGLIYFFKQKNYQLLLLLVLSILYYTILLGWYGMTRLFVPSLIYLSFFFGNGLVLLIDLLKKNNLIKKQIQETAKRLMF
jgi:hypothetical protein